MEEGFTSQLTRLLSRAGEGGEGRGPKVCGLVFDLFHSLISYFGSPFGLDLFEFQGPEHTHK